MRGIYKIENKVNGKKYVGSSVGIERRFLDHRSYLRRGAHKNKHLQSSWNKHGEEMFGFSALEVMPFSEEATIREIENYYLNKLQPEYNAAVYATRSPMYGKKASLETKKILSNQRKGRNSIWWGKHLPEETRRKIRDSQRGEKANGVKLTNEEVLEIRRLYAKGNIYQRELAAQYGVARQTISKIIVRRQWKHI